MSPSLPPSIRQRLKPGVMFRAEDAPGQWRLYHPAYDAVCRLTTGTPDDDQLGVQDLQSNERSWDQGRLHVDRYHTAQTFRAHQDAREVNLEINYRCQYACQHCFQTLRPAHVSAATPDWDSVVRAARRLLDAGAEEISITGGDIFLQPLVWDLLDFFHEQAPSVTLRVLVSGGALEIDSPAARDRLARLAGRRVIFKSDFFGHRADLHDDFTRVQGSFDKLVQIARLLDELELAYMATAAMTRMNFETRFELVNFLYNLTGNRFSVASVIYPSDERGRDALDGLRLSPEQHAELMEEQFFYPLAAEYHSFESPCAGDCQFAVASAGERGEDAWGCSFLKRSESPRTSPPDGRLPVLGDVITHWRAGAQEQAWMSECPTCPARATCRKCPSFLAAGQVGDSYCTLSRQAFPWLAWRVRTALSEEFAFVHDVPESAFAATGGDFAASPPPTLAPGTQG